MFNMKIKVDNLKAAFLAKCERFKHFLKEDDNDVLFLLHLFSIAFGLLAAFLLIAAVCCVPVLFVLLGVYVLSRAFGNWILKIFDDSESENEENDNL